jgi:site-specific DNA-adenine methylase
VWSAFGQVENYVEPFAGSAAMLLRAPHGKRIETLNDKDGFIANFWREQTYMRGTLGSCTSAPR